MSVIEFGKLKLRAGVTDAQFLAAEGKIRTGRIRQQPGYEGREVGKDADGMWYVIIRWATKENAEAWTPVFMQDPDGQALASLLDFGNTRQEWFTTVSP